MFEASVRKCIFAIVISALFCVTPTMPLITSGSNSIIEEPVQVDDAGQIVPCATDGTIEFPSGDDEGGDVTITSVRAPLGNSISVGATAYNSQRKLLRDMNGLLHAVFTKNGEIHYTNSMDDGISWLGTVDLSGSASEAKNPSMAITGNFIYIVWTDGPNITFRRSGDLGSTWIPPLSNPPTVLNSTINGPKSPVVAGDNLELVITWSGFNVATSNYDIMMIRSVDNGTNFSPVTPITSTATMANRPALSAQGTNYFLVYQDGPMGDHDIFFKSSVNSGQTWSAPVDVSGTNGDSTAPNLLQNGTNLYLAWVDISNNNPEILFKKSIDSGQNWDFNPFKISDNPSRSSGPGLAEAPNGDLYAVWFDNYEQHMFNNTFIRRWNSTSGLWEPAKWSNDLDEGYSYPNLNPFATSSRIEWIFTHGRQPTYSIRYNWHYIQDNEDPTLTWTQDTNYENNGLFPETGGTTAHTYTFKVNYTDQDNNEPVSGVHVLVDYNMDGRYDFYDGNENRKMSEAQPWDDDYTDGKKYIYSMNYPGIGQDYQYRFWAKDSVNNLATGVGTDSRNYPDINIVDHKPRLFWTNEKGYSSDGVEPSTGTSSTAFTWHISYYDEDNDPPALGYPKVLIDMNNNTLFGSNEYFNMTELDPEDSANDDGKFYSFSSTLPNVGDYRYRFVAHDVWDIENPSTDKPAIPTTGPRVTTINTPPIVSFPSSAGFTDDGIDPNEGSTSRVFVFRLIYTDAENNPPADGYPKVWIDLDLDTSFSSTEKFTMNEENASDTNRTDGKVYTYETTYPEVGSYTYRFEARDIYDQQASGDAVSLKNGPDISKRNDAPTIEYPQIEGYGIDGVNPDTGRTSTRFRFMVEYNDINGDPPLVGYPRVWVDTDLDKVFSPQEVFVMEEVDGSDTTYDDGKYYSYSLFLNDTGRSSYYFEAWDGFDGYATGLATEHVGGPDVGTSYNNAPLLEWVTDSGFIDDGIDPNSGPNTQTFTFKVLYTDFDNDAPDTYFPKLFLDLNGNSDFNDSNERQTLYEDDGDDQDFSDGKVYYFETDLTTSFVQMGLTYTYIFHAQDSRGTEAIGEASKLMFGPDITAGNNPPELLWPGDLNYEGDGLHPETGNKTMQFTYRVVYQDDDNDPPDPGSPKVMIDLDPLGKTMVKEDSTDIDYTDGVIYTYSTTLSLGSHSYRFIAFDKFKTKALSSGAPLKTMEGPLVEENEAPVLVWPTGDFTNGVSKTKGEIGSIFTFSVIYKDMEGDRPANGFPRLLVDRNDDGDYTDSIESLALIKGVSSDNKNGVTYSIDIILEKGKHTYQFEAKDVKGNIATGEPTEPQSAGVKVIDAQVTSGGDMMIYLILIIIIVVALFLGLMIGKKIGGGDSRSKIMSEQPQEVSPDMMTQEQVYSAEGYGYVQAGYEGDPNQAYYQGQEQEQSPSQQPPAQPPSQQPPAQPPSQQPPAQPPSQQPPAQPPSQQLPVQPPSQQLPVQPPQQHPPVQSRKQE